MHEINILNMPHFNVLIIVNSEPLGNFFSLSLHWNALHKNTDMAELRDDWKAPTEANKVLLALVALRSSIDTWLHAFSTGIYFKMWSNCINAKTLVQVIKKNVIVAK